MSLTVGLRVLLNDLVTKPVLGEVSWSFYYLLLFLTFPVWSVALLSGFILDLVTGRFATREFHRQSSLDEPILLTCCDHPLALDLVTMLVEDGWKVYAGYSTGDAKDRLETAAACFREKENLAMKEAIEENLAAGRGPERNPVMGSLVPVYLDVTKSETASAAASIISQDHPTKGLFALIHTAVAVQGGLAEWLAVEDFRRVTEVNYMGLVCTTLAMLPLLKQAKSSRIVSFVPTACTLSSVPLLSAMSAPFSAVLAFLASLRSELAPWGVHVSTVFGAFVPPSAGGRASSRLVETMRAAWQRLSEEKRLHYYGVDYIDESTDLLRTWTEEVPLRARHLIQALHHAAVASKPCNQYYIGIDARFTIGVLGALPQVVRDPLIQWLTYEKLTPASVLMSEILTDEQNEERRRQCLSSFELDGNGEEEEEEEVPPSLADCCWKKEGRPVEEDFELLEKLGEGTFAVVHRAKDRTRGFEVAIKVIKPLAFSSAAMVKALSTEMQVMARVCRSGHPSLMAFVSAYEGHHSLSFVLELLAGGDLFDRVVAQGHCTERQASVVMEQLLQGLQHLHAHGHVVHRDIKVVVRGAVGEDPRDLSFTGSRLAGTPPYLAPEIVTRRLYCPANDLWAAGVVLYVLLTGHQPFSGGSHSKLFAKIAAGDYKPPQACLSSQAQDLILRLLDAEPLRRPTAAEALEHPFISLRHVVPNTPLRDGSLEGLCRLRAHAKFKAMAKVAIAGTRSKLLLQEAVQHSQSLGEEEAKEAAAMWGGENMGTAGMDLQIVPQNVNMVRAAFADEADGQGHLDKAGFVRLMKKLHCANLPYDRIFHLFDLDGSGHVDQRELLLGLAKLDPSSPESIAFCFDLLDADGSGGITHTELADVLIRHHQRRAHTASMMAASSPKSASAAISTTPEEPDVDLPIMPQMSCYTETDQPVLECVPEYYKLCEAVCDLFHELDANADGVVSREEFLRGVERRPTLLRVIVGEGNIISLMKAETIESVQTD